MQQKLRHSSTNSGAVMAESYEQLERKYSRLSSKYAALQASHARLLEALNDFVIWFQDGETGPGFLDAAQEAIAAAQPSTETPE